MIIAIVQARMGSSRLPEKVMKDVLGKPLVDYLLERVSLSKQIDKVIVATTINKEDDLLAEHIQSLGYEVYRGSEKDVLERYYKTYFLYKNENVQGIVRITGDCPLIEASNCDDLIINFLKKELSYSNLSQKYAEGLGCEIFTPKLLIEAYENAKLDSEREHVTQYFFNNRDQFNIETLDKVRDDSAYRITVDEYEDFLVVERIIIDLNKRNIDLNFENIKEYLDNTPEIYFLNSKISRNEGLLKSLKNENENGMEK